MFILNYRYNYKTIEISEEDLTYTLSNIRDVIEKEGEFNYERLVNQELIKKKKENEKENKDKDLGSPSRAICLDQNTPREMYDTWIMVDGSKYKGQFLKGGTIKDGIGQMIYPDGSLFEGIFKKDDTVKGRFIFTNGTVFKGEMRNHKMHGKGILKYKKKVIYKGKFINGEKCDELKSLPTKLNDILNDETRQISWPVKSVQWDLNKS